MTPQSSYLARHFGNTGFPPMDIFETSEAYFLEIDLPGGIDPQQVNLSYGAGNLVIRGKLPHPALPEGGRYLQVERQAGQFHRVVHLSAPVRPRDISTRYDLGVLTITIPKEHHYEIQIEEHYAGQ